MRLSFRRKVVRIHYRLAPRAVRSGCCPSAAPECSVLHDPPADPLPAAAPRLPPTRLPARGRMPAAAARKSVVSGKGVSVRVDLGGRRIIQKQKKEKKTKN